MYSEEYEARRSFLDFDPWRRIWQTNIAFPDTDNGMAKLLRVGVIGLGPRWQKRYKPALLAMRHRFRVALLCDAVPQRALREAKLLGCRAVGGPTALVEDDTVEAILLLDPSWYRLWPLEVACRIGKPVLCAELQALQRAGTAR